MNLRELARTLPNGLHDADLNDVSVSLAEGWLVLRLDLDVSDFDVESQKAHEAVEITLEGVKWFSITGPCYLAEMGPFAPRIDGFEPTEKQFPGLLDLSSEIRDDLWGLYMNDPWNSFIFVSAKSAKIVWKSQPS